MSLAAFSTSSSCTISTGECMYRSGIETTADGMPARAMWNASASVPVARALAATVNGIPSASPAACRSSKTAGCSVEPRVSTAPEPNLWRPISFSSAPGESVANVTSTTTAMSGLSE